MAPATRFLSSSFSSKFVTRASVVNLEEAVAANDRPGQFAVTNRFKHLNLLDAKIVINTTRLQSEGHQIPDKLQNMAEIVS